MSQDYEPIVFRSKNKRTTGGPTTVASKFDAGRNRQGRQVDARNLDGEDVELKTVGREVGQAIVDGRTAKGWNRKELARRIAQKESVVADLETGRALLNQALLAKVERQLGVKLRGKDIGSPLVRGKK